jgi:hypothetical protein
MKSPSQKEVRWHTLSYLFTLQIVIIVVLAAILRISYLDQPLVDAFSWRQASTAMMAENFYQTNWNILYPEVNWTGPGPNYQGREFQTVSYLAALLYIPFGQQDWIGRGIAVLFGLWGIFALYQLVRLVWDEKRATVSAAVMAVLPGSIFIERSFLPDPAMVALITTSLWLFVLYLYTERWSHLLWAGLIAAWGACTKIPGLIIGLPMAYAWVTILGYRRAFSSKKLLSLSLFGLIVLIPVIAYYLWARHLALSYPPHHFAGASNWIWVEGISAWLAESYFLAELLEILRVWMWGEPVLVLVVVGLLRSVLPSYKGSSLDATKPIWLFHFWFLAFAFFYFIGASELIKNPWNFHLINPAAAALAGDIIVRLSSIFGFQKRNLVTTFTPRLKLSVSNLTSVVILFVIFLGGQRGLEWMYYPYAQRSYNLGVALQQATAPDDLLVTMAESVGDPIALYYSERRGWVFPPASPWIHMPENDGKSIQLLEDLRAKGASWFGVSISHFYTIEQEHPALMDYLLNTTVEHSRSSDYVIYRFLDPGEVATSVRAEEQQRKLQQEDIGEAKLVTREIHYHLTEAENVSLVWGYNGWRVLPQMLRPPGTVIEDMLMYTPMNREVDVFVTRVQLPVGATFEYGFLVTEARHGKPSQIWDGGDGEPIYITDESHIVVNVQPLPPTITERIDRLLGEEVRANLLLVLAIVSIFSILARQTANKVTA